MRAPDKVYYPALGEGIMCWKDHKFATSDA